MAFRAGLGILLIAIGLYNLRTSVLPRLEHIRWAHAVRLRVRFSRQRIQRERGAGCRLRDPEALAARRLQGDAAGVLLSLDPAHCRQPCVGRAVDRGRFRILSAGRACHHCRRFSGQDHRRAHRSRPISTSTLRGAVGVRFDAPGVPHIGGRVLTHREIGFAGVFPVFRGIAIFACFVVESLKGE